MLARLRSVKFDLVELLLIVVALNLLWWRATRVDVVSSDYESGWFAEQYGPDRNSEHGEEWFVRDYFGTRRNGFFLDVGAYHYRDGSNTYYLESELGWAGIAVEPQVEFAADYARHRPRTAFVPLFVSDTSDAEAAFFVVPGERRTSSAEESFAAGFGNTERRQVATIRLDDLLDRRGVSKIDFLSMDIELHEPQALAGFSIRRFKPELVCIEAHYTVRQRILEYFYRNEYIVHGKYLRADRQNLWFSPAPKSEPRRGSSVRPGGFEGVEEDVSSP